MSHTGPGLTFRVSESISAANRKAWNRVAGDKFFLTTRYLSAVEDARLAGMSFRYVEVFNHTVLAGVLYFQLADLSSREMGSFLDLSEYGRLASRAGDLVHRILYPENKKKDEGRYILVSGSLLVSGNHGIAVADEKYRLPVFEMIPVIADAIGNEIKNAGGKVVAVSVKDFYKDEDPVARSLTGHRFHRMVIDPNMIVDINPAWGSWEGYLAAMSSKYRVRANNAVKKMDQVTFRYLDAGDVEKHAERLEELYINVQKKAPVRIVRANARYFIAMKHKLGDRFVMRVFEYKNEIIAFTAGYRHKKDYEAHFIGIDYHYNKSHSLYLNILYDFIREAILHRARRLYFGRTALEIKSTVGARPHGLSAYLRVNNRMLNGIVRHLLPPSERTDWKPRSPFK